MILGHQIYIDNTVAPSTTYCYRVSPSKTSSCPWDPGPAVDDLYSEVCTETAPAAPSALSASVNGMVVALSWQDNSTDEDGFEILKMLANGRFVTIKTVDSNVQTYTDTLSMQADSFYSYRVRSIRGAERSAFVEIVTTDPTVWEDPICVD